MENFKVIKVMFLSVLVLFSICLFANQDQEYSSNANELKKTNQKKQLYIYANSDRICRGEKVMLEAEYVGKTRMELTYHWSAPMLCFNANQQKIEVHPNLSAWFYLKVLNSNYGFVAVDSIFIELVEPSSNIEISIDSTILNGEMIKIFINNKTINRNSYSWSWIIDNQIISADLNLLLVVNKSNKYRLEIIATHRFYGCTKQATVFIKEGQIIGFE